MQNKKEFTIKSYSGKIYPLCIVGIAFIILSNFIRFLVPDEILNISYAAIYLVVCIIAVAIFIVRNSYNTLMTSKHKKFAVLTIVAAIVIFARRIFVPHIFTGFLSTWVGNEIDFETIITIIMSIFIGMPMFDLLQMLKYMQPAQTHISDKEN